MVIIKAMVAPCMNAASSRGIRVQVSGSSTPIAEINIQYTASKVSLVSVCPNYLHLFIEIAKLSRSTLMLAAARHFFASCLARASSPANRIHNRLSLVAALSKLLLLW
jgi:hypothetical protein